MGARVLIVDDVVCSRHLVKRGLEPQGHTVFDVGTAAEAIAILKKESIELIVIDLLMPAKEGFEQFNQLARASGIPIFALTVNIDESYIKKAVLYGIKEMLRKPLNFDHFNTLIEKHCTKQANRSSKIQITVTQSVLDAVQAEASKANLPLEVFLNASLSKLFAPAPAEAPAVEAPVAEPVSA